MEDEEDESKLWNENETGKYGDNFLLTFRIPRLCNVPSILIER